MNACDVRVFGGGGLETFFLPYTDLADGNRLVKEHRKIVQHYLRGWFALDLVSLVPYGLLGQQLQSAALEGMQARRMSSRACVRQQNSPKRLGWRLRDRAPPCGRGGRVFAQAAGGGVAISRTHHRAIVSSSCPAPSRSDMASRSRAHRRAVGLTKNG